MQTYSMALMYQPVLLTSGKGFFQGFGEGLGDVVGVGEPLGEGLGDPVGPGLGDTTGTNSALTVTFRLGILKVYLPDFSVSSTALF